MAESLSTEQLEERRTNLRAFRDLLEMEDDSELNTTLRMQEEWLATVDELQTEIVRLTRGLYYETVIAVGKERDALAEELAREEDCVCKGGFVDYIGPPCPVHSIPDEGEPVSEHRIRPMPPCDDQPECEASGQAHVWVKLGKVNEAAIMEWGPSKCLRCNEPYDLEFAGSDE